MFLCPLFYLPPESTKCAYVALPRPFTSSICPLSPLFPCCRQTDFQLLTEHLSIYCSEASCLAFRPYWAAFFELITDLVACLGYRSPVCLLFLHFYIQLFAKSSKWLFSFWIISHLNLTAISLYHFVLSCSDCHFHLWRLLPHPLSKLH